MATPSGVLAWRTPGTEGPGRLQSTGSRRVTQRSDLAQVVRSDRLTRGEDGRFFPSALSPGDSSVLGLTRPDPQDSALRPLWRACPRPRRGSVLGPRGSCRQRTWRWPRGWGHAAPRLTGSPAETSQELSPGGVFTSRKVANAKQGVFLLEAGLLHTAGLGSDGWGGREAEARGAGDIREAEPPRTGGRARGAARRGHLAPLHGDGREGRLRRHAALSGGAGAGAVGSAHPLEPRRPMFEL